MVNFDFPLILLLLVVITGVIAIGDFIFRVFTKRADKSIIIEYSRAFFPVLLIVFMIRSFAVQMYRVPTGSLEPTIMPGDLVLISQYSYGIRFPVWDKKFINVGEPKTGQIAPFHSPVNPAEILIKRVIGVPGDHISYINKVLYINGKEMKQTFVRTATDGDGPGQPRWNVNVYQENLNGVVHDIYIRPDQPADNFYNLVVPKDEYLMMGDNRDNSDDGRYWGFAPEKNFIGKADRVLLNWDPYEKSVFKKLKLNRSGQKL